MTERRLLLSIRRLSDEFGMARETIAKRIDEAGIAPADHRAGHPVFRLRDVVPALMGERAIDDEGRTDPAKLKPQDRRAWFQSENERLKFEQETGAVILAAEVHHEMAAVAKIVVKFLETLPDNIERDLRCGPEVVEYLLKKVRTVRTEIEARMSADDEGEDVRASA